MTPSISRLRGRLSGLSNRALVLVTLGGILVLALASFAWIYGDQLAVGGPIRSDGAGYYIYLPAALIDHDLTLTRTIDREYGGNVALLGGVRAVPPHGDFLDQYPIGEALMMAPFFVAGEVVAIATGEPKGGYSWPYQAAAAAAGLAAMLTGLALLASTLRRLFSRRTMVLTLLCITFGTDLFHYGTFDATFSHVYSFALTALALRLTISLWERPRLPPALGLGATLALATLVRPTNLVLLVFCALVGVDSLAALRRRPRTILRHLDMLAASTGIFLLVVLPQLAYWHMITGGFVIISYPSASGSLVLSDPHLIGVLFSVRKGLFFWTPLAALAVAGIAYLRGSTPALLVPSVAYLALYTWLVASWTVWSYGGSFGMRPFIDALPVLALGLGALIESARSRRARRLMDGALALTTLIAVHAMLGYWQHYLPYDGTTWSTYVSALGHP